MRLTHEEFEKIVKKGIAAIPDRFLVLIDNVAIVIEDNPSPAEKKELRLRKGYSLFGLYEGVPRTRRWGYGQILPDKITIFKNQIESHANTLEDIERIVKETVWHEIAHHFGMDEKQVREVEKRRK
ncbi:MAG: Possibl zinc metallo-peptidase [Parcubacteria group bacterium ADurb.Bin216]|nr:MAG: Possibl zinc metallo-peptidase [Parcubacteria group bacterium ADurb.Bin216]